MSNGVPGAWVPIPSPPASPQARSGDAGTPYGWQQSRTIAAGMAKPMPTLPPVGERIAVLMPTTRPSWVNSGPPELP